MLHYLLTIMESSSFFNVWFWIFLVFLWSRITYFTLGVSDYDARLAAQRCGDYMVDFERLLWINSVRAVEFFDVYGAVLVGLMVFFLTMEVTLGFGFGIEFMRATFLLMLPACAAGLFSLQLAYKIKKEKLSGMLLYKAYSHTRRIKQLLGIISMLLISLWAGIELVMNFNI